MDNMAQLIGLVGIARKRIIAQAFVNILPSERIIKIVLVMKGENRAELTSDVVLVVFYSLPALTGYLDPGH
jgi:hypothetical protein